MAVSAVASSASSVTLLSADSARKTVIIENSDANRLHIVFEGSAATTTTNYNISLAQYEKASLPPDVCGNEIRGIWAADGSGHALIWSE